MVISDSGGFLNTEKRVTDRRAGPRLFFLQLKAQQGAFQIGEFSPVVQGTNLG